MGTPLASMVPRIRQKRVIASILRAEPTTGTRCCQISKVRREDSLLMAEMRPPTNPASTKATMYQ